MTDAVRTRIRQMLEAHGTVTLATTGQARPWAAAVFYVSDEHFNLYFVSDLRTQHARDMAENPHVVGAVNADVFTWDDVRGLQIEGQCKVLPEEERADVIEMYLTKFADVRRLFEAPTNDSEKVIAQRLKSTAFWRLEPEWIRLIDNREGFGWKKELPL